MAGYGIEFRGAMRRLKRSWIVTLCGAVIVGCATALAGTVGYVANALWLRNETVKPGIVRLDSGGFELSQARLDELSSNPPTTLQGMAQFGTSVVSVRIRESAVRVQVAGVSPGFFSLFGAVPVIGRLPVAGDETAGYPVAVVSESLWKATASGDPTRLGDSLYIAGHHLPVVGVLPDAFEGPWTPFGVDVWVPTNVIPPSVLFARLAIHRSIEEASAEMHARYAVQGEGARAKIRVSDSLKPELPSSVHELVAVVLIAGCVFIAIAVGSGSLLLLARILAHRSDLAIRSMLGARPTEVVSGWCLEVVVVTALGACVGAAMSKIAATRLFDRVVVIAGHPGLRMATGNEWWPVAYVVLATATAMTGILYVLGRRLLAGGLLQAATEGGAGGATIRTGLVSKRLVTAQVTLSSFAILLGAALLGEGNGAKGGPAMLPSDVIVVRLDQQGADRALISAGNERVMESVQRTEGIEAAAFASRLFDRVSLKVRVGGREHFGDPVRVTPSFFDVMHLRPLYGRVFATGSVSAGVNEVVLSASAARAWFGDAQAVGNTLEMNGRPFLVVGVVPDLPDKTGRGGVRDLYVLHNTGSDIAPVVFPVVLARGRRPAIDRTIAERVARDVPEMGVISVRALSAELGGAVEATHFIGQMSATLGVGALVIALVGLCAMTAVSASERGREFGIRLAVGATPIGLVALAVRQGGRPIGHGLALSCAAILALSSVLGGIGRPILPVLHIHMAVALAGALLLSIIALVLPYGRVIRQGPSDLLREKA